jgi:hypothetical protein
MRLAQTTGHFNAGEGGQASVLDEASSGCQHPGMALPISIRYCER